MGKPVKVARVGGECVACGTCVEACPVGAILIYHGVTARIDEKRCLGCGRCAKTCPAGVIQITGQGDAA